MDGPIAEASTTFTRQTTIIQVGFEPSIPASEKTQTHTFDRAATRNMRGTNKLWIYCDQDSSGGIVTRYKLSRLGFESWGWEAEIVSSHPDQPCGSHNLLYNGYQVFFEGKVAGAWSRPPKTFWLQGLNNSSTFPQCLHRHAIGWRLPPK
jgi:hypothetical protein